VTAVLPDATGMTANERIILGQQLADARANEAARVASGGHAPSPLPAGQYDRGRGDYDLTAVAQSSVDEALGELARAFKNWTPETRAAARDRISLDDQYTLIHFARRCAVAALNANPVPRVEEGLLALAMIDETRIDWRDGVWAVGLLAHAMRTAGLDPNGPTQAAAALATPGMAAILLRALDDVGLSEWGYMQIRTARGGTGLIRSGGARYAPTLDMTGLALRLTESLREGRYLAEPEVAADVPTVWFPEAGRARASDGLQTARGAISLHGTLKDGGTPPRAQHLIQWVVEMPTAEAASALVEALGGHRHRGGRCVLGLSCGRLFSLIVAGSSVAGVESFETPDSLTSIATHTRALLFEALEASLP
jgi:hypothetical protein